VSEFHYCFFKSIEAAIMTDHDTGSSRRDFIKTTTLAMGATALGSSYLNSAIFAGGDDVIRVGLVGSGGRGSGAAVQALSTIGNIRLTAVGDAFADNADKGLRSITSALKEKADRVQVVPEKIFIGFDAYQKVIDSGIDLVILTTPPGFRPMQFEYAVNAGKHIFMEKPVAVDAPGVRQILAANKIAKKNKLKIGVGLQRHHQAPYLAALSRIKEGAIGDIVSMRVNWNSGGVFEPRLSRSNSKSEMEYQLRNWYYYNWLSGDHICEQHIHNLDVGNWLKGDHPIKANGMGGRQVRVDKKYGEIFDHHYVEYEYRDGSFMHSQCRHQPGCWNSVSEFAQGTLGRLALMNQGSGAEISGSKVNWSFEKPRLLPNQVERDDPYQVEHDDLMAAIRNGLDFNEADNGAYSTMTAILGRMATYGGQEVSWDAAINSNISLMPKVFSFDADPQVMPNADGAYPIAVPGLTKVI
jgi:predicted dehydrogenase